jgi:hypothetical protein
LANIELNEFGVKFYYDIDESGINQYGYLSKSGKTRIIYNTPFEKMRFPLTYSDYHSSNFSGEYFTNNISAGQIEGNSVIEADAWGTIRLPGDISYSNTVRVKSEKNYTVEFTNSTQNVKMITYRWYNSVHRYPLLVLIETTVENGTKTSKSTQAAYNLNAVNIIENNIQSTPVSVSIYPNPVIDELTVEVSGEKEALAYITITDISGREVLSPQKREIFEGMNIIPFTDEIAGLREGIYILKIDSGGEIFTKEFTVKK